MLFIPWSDDQGWRPRLTGWPKTTQRCLVLIGSLSGENFDGFCNTPGVSLA
jgi:hypothetical protein